MTTAKLVDSNRRTHAAKVLAKASTKNQHHDDEMENSEANLNTASMKSGKNSEAAASNDIISSLNEQYSVIREDILKLREDLAHGYDLIKDIIDSRLNIRSLLKLSK